MRYDVTLLISQLRNLQGRKEEINLACDFQWDPSSINKGIEDETWQQDDDSKHTAQETKEWLQ